MGGTPAALTREQLLEAILEFISGDDLLPLDDVRAALAAEMHCCCSRKGRAAAPAP